jgi:hypothetical protein
LSGLSKTLANRKSLSVITEQEAARNESMVRGQGKGYVTCIISCLEAKPPPLIEKSASNLLSRLQTCFQAALIHQRIVIGGCVPCNLGLCAAEGLNINANGGSFCPGVAKPFEDKLGVAKIYLK